MRDRFSRPKSDDFGFLGHAYVGQWVNLGALTTNSDLKNDYSDVSVSLDGGKPIDTGSRKVGALIGDHTKTSIRTLFNTGAYVGAMGLIAGTGKPLPKFIPSFAWFLEGVVTKGFGRKKLYKTAKTAMGRRRREWTPAQEAMWEAVFDSTAPARNAAIKKGRRSMVKKPQPETSVRDKAVTALLFTCIRGSGRGCFFGSLTDMSRLRLFLKYDSNFSSGA